MDLYSLNIWIQYSPKRKHYENKEGNSNSRELTKEKSRAMIALRVAIPHEKRLTSPLSHCNIEIVHYATHVKLEERFDKDIKDQFRPLLLELGRIGIINFHIKESYKVRYFNERVYKKEQAGTRLIIREVVEGSCCYCGKEMAVS